MLQKSCFHQLSVEVGNVVEKSRYFFDGFCTHHPKGGWP